MALRLWHNSIAHGLKSDQAIMKYEGIYSVGHACSRRVSGPLKKKNIIRVDGFDSPLRFRKSLEKVGKETAYRVLTTENTRWANEDGVVSVIHQNSIEIFGTKGLCMVSKDLYVCTFWSVSS